MRVSAERKPEQVCAAFVRVDVVREGENQLRVTIVPLQRDFGVDAFLGALYEDRLVVDDRFVLVQVLDEGDDPAVVLKPVVLPVALVMNSDQDAAVQERQFSQSLCQRIEAVVDGLENLLVRLEGDFGARR